MYHDRVGPRVAIDCATKMLHECYNRFYEEEQKLYGEVEPESLKDVELYVQACKELIMGNLYWRWVENSIFKARDCLLEV